MNLYQKVNKSIKKFDLLSQTETDERYPRKLTVNEFYVGGTGASDSNDGESPDKPFATIPGAFISIYSRYTGGHIVLKLQDDITVESNNLGIQIPIGGMLTITSANPNEKKTISVRNGAFIAYDHRSAGRVVYSIINFHSDKLYTHHLGDSSMPLTVCFYNCSFSADVPSTTVIHVPSPNVAAIFNGTTEFINCNSKSLLNVISGGTAFFCYGAKLVCENCTCTIATVKAANGGTIIIDASTNFSGTVTGKRYDVICGGRIITCSKGPNHIPGSEAGTCDETSIYA